MQAITQATTQASMAASNPMLHGEPAAGPAAAEISRDAQALLQAARNEAYAQASQGRLGHGLQVLMEALQHEPLHHDLLSDMAALLLSAGELEHALEFAGLALGVQAQHGVSLYSMGFALAGLGRHEEAVEVLSRIEQGEALQSLMAEAPDLLPLVQTELQRLRALLAPAAVQAAA